MRTYIHIPVRNLNAPIATRVVCFSRLLKCLRRSLYGKQRGPRTDCSYRSSLFWVHAFCFYTKFVSNFRQLFAAVDYSRRHFQMHFFLGALRVNFSENNWSRTGVVDKPLALLIDIFQLPRTLGFVRCSTH